MFTHTPTFYDFMAKLVDMITLLPNPYEKVEDTVILRTTEKEIEEAFLEMA